MDSNNSSCSKSSTDNPHTPPQLSHITQSRTRRSFTAPSKPAQQMTTPIGSANSLKQSESPLNPTPASAPSTLDWGGEWGRIVKELKLGGDKGVSTAQLCEDDLQLHEKMSPVRLESINLDNKHDGNDKSGYIDDLTTEELFRDSKDDDGVESSKEQSVSEDSLESQLPKTKFSTTEDGFESDSNESVIHQESSFTSLSEAKTHTTNEEYHSPPTTAGPSSQTILRGLIRDAHREMMYFTLPHSSFTIDDLRAGLDYAFGMLSAAITKLAILTVLIDDLADLQGADVRNWIAAIEALNPQTCYEPRVPVVFKCLSAGEVRLALAEMVQSRVIVEDELKRTRKLLQQRAEDLKRKMELQKEEYENAALDAWMTAIMVTVIGALYLAVR